MSVVRSIVTTAVASLALVAAARSPEPAPLTGIASYGKDYSRSVSKDDFGAGFQIYAKASVRDYAQLCVSTNPDVQCARQPAFFAPICKQIWKIQNQAYCSRGNTLGMTAEGKAGADVTMFGKDFDLFDIGARADAEPDATTASYGIYVLGKKIKGSSATVELAANVPLAERTLVSASAQFMLGPVPITVQAEATGTLGIEFSMGAGTAQVNGQARPYASVDGVFSAGVGTKGLSAGVYGDLLLVEVSTPANASLAWKGGKSFAYDASLDLQLNALDGSVGLYGEFGPWKKNWEIFSWTGLEYTYNLGRMQGTFNL